MEEPKEPLPLGAAPQLSGVSRRRHLLVTAADLGAVACLAYFSWLISYSMACYRNQIPGRLGWVALVLIPTIAASVAWCCYRLWKLKPAWAEAIVGDTDVGWQAYRWTSLLGAAVLVAILELLKLGMQAMGCQ